MANARVHALGHGRGAHFADPCCWIAAAETDGLSGAAVLMHAKWPLFAAAAVVKEAVVSVHTPEWLCALSSQHPATVHDASQALGLEVCIIS